MILRAVTAERPSRKRQIMTPISPTTEATADVARGLITESTEPQIEDIIYLESF